MAGLLGALNQPYAADPTTVAEQIAKLKGRSQAMGLLGQLNQPYIPLTGDVMKSMQDLAANRFSTSRELVPAAGRSIVPYGAEAGQLATMAPTARVLQGVGGSVPAAASAARYGLPALPAAAGGGGGGFIPPGGGGGIPSAAGFGGSFNPGGAAFDASSLLSAGGTASNVGGIAGRFLQNPNASGIARFLDPKLVSAEGKIALRGVGGRALLYGGLGIAGAQAINAVVPGNPHYQRTLANAAVGAGTGAAIGSVVPGIGTAVGALAGGTIGALSSLWNKDSAPKTEKQRNKLIDQLNSSNLPDNVKASIGNQYATLYQLAESDEEKQAAFDAAKTQLVEAIANDAQLSQDADTMLASQAMLQQFLQPTVRGMVPGAQREADLLSQIAGGLPQELRAPALVSANQRVSNANRIAGAYAQQMTSIPQIAALQLQAQRAQQPQPAADLQALLAGG